MADFRANQGNAASSLSDNAGHSASASQTGGGGGQQGESKTPGLSSRPAESEPPAAPWSPRPTPGDAPQQTPVGCTRAALLLLSAFSLLAALSLIVLRIA